MDTKAELWEGSIEDIDDCYDKIVNLMETVHNLDGNFDENEVLHVVKDLQDFTINDMESIDKLNIDLVDIDD